MSIQGNVAAVVDGETHHGYMWNEKNMLYLANTSGGSLASGAVVVADAASDNAFKTTTTQDDQSVLGVIPQIDNVSGTAGTQTIANAASGYVQFASYITTVNVQGNVTRGHYLRTSATAGRAEDAGATPTKGSFAIATTGYAGGAAGTVSVVMLTRSMAGISDHTLLTNIGTNTHAQIDSALARSVVTTESGAVATGTTILPLDNTIPQKTEGDEYLTATIIPNNATNVLVVTVTLMLSGSVPSNVCVALFQDAMNDALAAIASDNGAVGQYNFCVLLHRMVAGTTAPMTLKVRAGLDRAGTLTLNGSAGSRLFGGVAASTMTIIEVPP